MLRIFVTMLVGASPRMNKTEHGSRRYGLLLSIHKKAYNLSGCGKLCNPLESMYIYIYIYHNPSVVYSAFSRRRPSPGHNSFPVTIPPCRTRAYYSSIYSVTKLPNYASGHFVWPSYQHVPARVDKRGDQCQHRRLPGPFYSSGELLLSDFYSTCLLTGRKRGLFTSSQRSSIIFTFTPYDMSLGLFFVAPRHYRGPFITAEDSYLSKHKSGMTSTVTSSDCRQTICPSLILGLGSRYMDTESL